MNRIQLFGAVVFAVVYAVMADVGTFVLPTGTFRTWAWPVIMSTLFFGLAVLLRHQVYKARHGGVR